MSDIIRLLPDSVANQIAAGEVIQRPASVVKELVENAVDAGATDIRIYIKDAGRTLIQVVDNGKGMSETDARMAFERHATSKISQAGDLFSLATMGFRGEALPSICAISQVELKTCTEDSLMGTRLLIEGSRVDIQEPCMCEKGTSMSVRNLFFNVPARRKFLKSDNVELSNVMREFERLALVNNDKHLLLDTGNKVIDLPAATFKKRISDIWKNNLNMQILPVEVETSLIKIHGFVSRPEFARLRNPLQFLIVNGRNMRHPYFHKAIINCYENLVAPGTQPCYFLKFEVDPASIDVNIHPTKNEIKFEYEQQIWPILQASVKAALGKYSAVPSIDFNTDVVPVNPLRPGEEASMPNLDIPENYNPFEMSPEFAPAPGQASGGGDTDAPRRFSSKGYDFGKDFHARKASSNWESLYAGFMENRRQEAPVQQETQPELPSLGDMAPSAMCIQFAAKYIVASTREGILVIDQHRAHVKVLYEQCLREVRGMEKVSQTVMFPETVTLDPEHQAALESVTPELERLGFMLVYEEEDRWRIEGVPAMIKDGDPKDVVLRILDSVCEDSENYGREGASADRILERMALLMARSSAIVRGKKLSQEEMEHLVGQLFALPDPALTPNGNKVYVTLDEHLVASML